MRTSPKLVVILLAAALTGACASATSMADPLVGALAKGGLSPQQAVGGAGADKYINQARTMTGETGPISGMPQVQGMFSKMGISPEQGAELTKNFGDFVGSKVGGPLGDAVTAVLK